MCVLLKFELHFRVFGPEMFSSNRMVRVPGVHVLCTVDILNNTFKPVTNSLQTCISSSQISHFLHMYAIYTRTTLSIFQFFPVFILCIQLSNNR